MTPSSNGATSHSSSDSTVDATEGVTDGGALQDVATDTTHASVVLPDRLSIDPTSAHYDEAVLRRDIGIRFKGSERTDVEEYCVSEAWIKVAAGRAIDRRGRPILIKLKGVVEPYYKALSAQQ
jgi:hypothetical protein